MARCRIVLVRLLLCAGFLLPFVPLTATAQSNAVIDQLLKQTATSAGDAAYIVLSAANVVNPDVTVDQALAAAEQNGWIAKVSSDSTISFGQFSYLIMKSFKMSGGLMYTLFPGPRYAARELFYRGLVPTELSPYEPVSGEKALFVLRSVLSARG